MEAPSLNAHTSADAMPLRWKRHSIKKTVARKPSPLHVRDKPFELAGVASGCQGEAAKNPCLAVVKRAFLSIQSAYQDRMSLLKMLPMSQRLVAYNQVAGHSCRSMATVVDKIKEKAGAWIKRCLATPSVCGVEQCPCSVPLQSCVCLDMSSLSKDATEAFSFEVS